MAPDERRGAAGRELVIRRSGNRSAGDGASANQHIDRPRLRNARSAGLDGLVHGNMFSLPFSEDEFDCVLSLEVLEHLEEPERAVRELRRMSSSALVVSVPNDPVFRFGNVVRLHNVSSLGDHPDHTQHFSSFSFPRFLSSHVPVEDVSMPGYVWTICLADVSA